MSAFTSAMTSRQRMLAAVRNQQPDCVPVAPDISGMVPTRLSGKGMYGVHIHQDPPLWQAYLDAIDFYDMDGWFTYGAVELVTRDVEIQTRWDVWSDELRVQEIAYRTPAGVISQKIRYTPQVPPMLAEKLIKDIDRDWPCFRYLLGEIVASDGSLARQQKRALGERGIFGIGIATPGFQMWNEYFEGGIITLSGLLAERPALLDELRELHHARSMQELEHYLKAQPDFILTGGSGSITMASPQLWRRYSLPTLKEHTEVCEHAGVLSMVHSCGKERCLVETCARETKLNCINPLEIPPMGDITLAEAKAMTRGTRLALMGNLHTTDVMLRGNVQTVIHASREAIDDAAQGGGFILSTGDQCGWATPDENIFAMVETARTYGRYNAPDQQDDQQKRLL